ncbi:unnamed protein product [Cylindrotheca closterium]|uniref:Uncharacterized protein n=1 Tax=Cylindrotheca closterium TaxID=2856 RepID=A0AAD2FMV8_9STRA|nr:unnamed protein product [Cylindrotheca closterium]
MADGEALLAQAASAPETPRRKLKKKSEGKGANKLGRSSSQSKKRELKRSNSGGIAANKTKGRVHRSLSEDDGESKPNQKLKNTSKATETSSLSSSKRHKRKAKKEASGASETRTRSPRTSKSPTRRSMSPLNLISPRSRREESSKSPKSPKSPLAEGGQLTKLYSWWDIAPKHAKLESDDGRDRTPSPPPPPPTSRHPASARSTNTRTMMRKTSDRELPPVPKSAVVTKRKISRRPRKGSFDSIEEHDGLEATKTWLSADVGGNDNDDDSSKKSKSKSKKKRPTHQKQKSEKVSSNYATLLDSPSTSSMTSTTSGESLKDRLKDARPIPQVASLGQLFDIAQGDTGAANDTDSEDDSVGTFASEQQVKWFELELNNPADIVIKAMGEDGSLETTTVPADSAMMNTLSDDISDSFRSTNSKHKHSTKRSKTPSLDETIARDQRFLQNRPSDERTSCTLGTGGTAESEQTAKAANHDARVSDTVPTFGSQDLKTEEEEDDNDNDDDGDDGNDKLDDASSHSRSSGRSTKSSKSSKSNKSSKSSKSLPTRRGGKKKKKDANLASSNHEPRRTVRRSKSNRRQARPKSEGGPRSRSRSGRATRKGSSHPTKPEKPSSSSSEIDEFMAMTKEKSNTAEIKENTDGTMSTATESTMTPDTTTRSRRGSVGAINQTLIQNFQLTF